VELALEKQLEKAGDSRLCAAGKPQNLLRRRRSPRHHRFSLCEWQDERTSCGAGIGRGGPDSSVVLDFENCMEQIWEQLIATPPSRGRSMTT